MWCCRIAVWQLEGRLSASYLGGYIAPSVGLNGPRSRFRNPNPSLDCRIGYEPLPTVGVTLSSPSLLAFQTQYAPDDARNLFPVRGLPGELFQPALGNGIKLGFAVVLRRAPNPLQ